MRLWDVNVLVYAFRRDAADHGLYRAWVERCLASDGPFGYAELVLSGFVRIVTHPRVFVAPDSLADALAFADALRGQPNAVPVAPGPRHWGIFKRLCTEARAAGNLVPDAYLAALAIESGSEWATTDGDYARFPGLKTVHPLHEVRP